MWAHSPYSDLHSAFKLGINKYLRLFNQWAVWEYKHIETIMTQV